jgi:hypothetical protein
MKRERRETSYDRFFLVCVCRASVVVVVLREKR